MYLSSLPLVAFSECVRSQTEEVLAEFGLPKLDVYLVRLKESHSPYFINIIPGEDLSEAEILFVWKEEARFGLNSLLRSCPETLEQVSRDVLSIDDRPYLTLTFKRPTRQGFKDSKRVINKFYKVRKGRGDLKFHCHLSRRVGPGFGSVTMHLVLDNQTGRYFYHLDVVNPMDLWKDRLPYVRGFDIVL